MTMSPDLGERSTRRLLSDWAAIMRELAHRDVVRTQNNPTGDIAEAIVQAHYTGSVRGSFSEKGWDVKTAAGERIQVKSMRVVPGKKRTKLSPIRDGDYDTVVIVIFDEDFRVTEGLRMSRQTAEAVGTYVEREGALRISVTAKLRKHPEVESIDLSDVLLDA
jgi:hypothetical protein